MNRPESRWRKKEKKEESQANTAEGHLGHSSFSLIVGKLSGIFAI